MNRCVLSLIVAVLSLGPLSPCAGHPLAPEQIQQMQERLHAAELYPGPIASVWGPQTEAPHLTGLRGVLQPPVGPATVS
jgi:hypothetical protein